MTRQRIRVWVSEFGEDGVYVSFSGGKDSTVLLDIVRKDYPDIEAVFVNTGLEYPSVRQFALSKENVTELIPTMNFHDVIVKYGYPIISKEVAGKVGEVRKSIEKGNTNTVRYRQLMGLEKKENGETSEYNIDRYKYLLNTPFLIHDRCCEVMKKAPIYRYNNKKKKAPFIGAMADESRNRRSKWIKHGCNAFDLKHPESNPLSFWTENDVLQYIHENNLDIANAYGKVVVKNNGIDGQMNIHDYLNDYRECQFETTGCKRTGCIFCGFGITQDKQRFIRLAEQESKLCDYIMRGGEFFYKVFDRNGKEIKLKHCSHKQIEKWCVDNSDNKDFKIESTWQPSKDGLGYWFVLEWLNVHGNLRIGIPNKEYYLFAYQSEHTKKHLEMEGKK